MNINKTGSRQFDKRPHRRRKWTVYSYSPGGTNVHSHVTHDSFGPSESTTKTASRSVRPFLSENVLSHENCPFSRGDSVPLSNTWFLTPIRVHNLDGISIGSAVFVQLRHSVVWHVRVWPFIMGILTPSHNRFLSPPEPITQTAS